VLFPIPEKLPLFRDQDVDLLGTMGFVFEGYAPIPRGTDVEWVNIKWTRDLEGKPDPCEGLYDFPDGCFVVFYYTSSPWSTTPGGWVLYDSNGKRKTFVMRSVRELRVEFRETRKRKAV
jgi:hypothetical protein